MRKHTRSFKALLDAAKCALLDLQGALQVNRAKDPFVPLDEQGVKNTIKELREAIKLADPAWE
jgi:hypothetical protein